ncbi:MAG: glycosyltransferase family 39 protein [Candidatus Omnitrophica bacterium]|nr:glycosyltransferase family 39 protein [Candidatus Omnitrophota bacterium]
MISDRKYAWIWDAFLPVSLVILFTFQKYFYQGLIDMWEAGVYLPFVNEVLHGKIIFKDVMIIRGPLEIFLPAFLMTFLGKHLSILNFWFYFGNVLTIIFLVLAAREIYRTRVFLYLLIPVLVAKTFSLVYYKTWGGLRYACGAMSIWLFLKFIKKDKWGWLFFSGFVSALGFFFSPDMGLFPFLAVTLVLIVFNPNKRFFKNFSCYLLGALVIGLPFFLYLLASGAIPEYLKNLLTMPRSGYTIYHFEILFPDMPHNPLEALKYTLQPFTPDFLYPLPIFIYLAVAVYFLKNYIKSRFSLINAAILCYGIYGLLVYFGAFRQTNGPQFTMAMQPALVFSFLILENCFLFFKEKQRSLERKPGIVLLGWVAIIITFLTVYFSVFTVKNYLRYGFDLYKAVYRTTSKGCFPGSTVIKPLNIDTAKGVLVPAWQADEINSVVGYIQARTSPGEAVFTFPDQGVYSFFFDRPCLSRFCQPDIASYRQEWSEEFFSKLEDNKPLYIVYRREVDSFEPMIKQYPLAKNRKRIREFIKSNYKVDAVFGRIDIYKLSDEIN